VGRRTLIGGTGQAGTLRNRLGHGKFRIQLCAFTIISRPPWQLISWQLIYESGLVREANRIAEKSSHDLTAAVV
jgi:hypothetical protein